MLPFDLKPTTINLIPPKKSKRNNLFVLIFAGLIHLEILLIAFYIATANSRIREKNIILKTEIISEYEPIDLDQKRVVIKITEDNEKIDEEPVVVIEEIYEPRQTENNQEYLQAEGLTNAISDVPLVGSSFMGNIGGADGGGGAFSSRNGKGKMKAIMKGGGSKQTEAAVDAALNWLMRHQEKDGHWDKNTYGVEKNNNGFERRKMETNSVLTALSALAFISAGHTPNSGKYKETVKKAIDWILKRQLPNGSFGDSFEFSCYNNSICALVLAELAGMCPDQKYKVAAQNSINFLENMKNVHEDFSNYSNIPRSTSVNGWLLMALKSAKISGLNVSPFIFEKLNKRLLEITTKDTQGNFDFVNYLDLGDRKNRPATITAVGMVMFEFLGSERNELTGLADKLIKDLPVYGEPNLNQEFYRWYNTTMALYQFGGEHWKTWNTAMSGLLVKIQRVGGPLDGSLEDVNGSWDFEKDHFGQNLGRIYTTAMGTLCLEVYYRYDPIYKEK